MWEINIPLSLYLPARYAEKLNKIYFTQKECTNERRIYHKRIV